MFKIYGVTGISKIKFFKFSSTERVEQRFYFYLKFRGESIKFYRQVYNVKDMNGYYSSTIFKKFGRDLFYFYILSIFIFCILSKKKQQEIFQTLFTKYIENFLPFSIMNWSIIIRNWMNKLFSRVAQQLKKYDLKKRGHFRILI